MISYGLWYPTMAAEELDERYKAYFMQRITVLEDKAVASRTKSQLCHFLCITSTQNGVPQNWKHRLGL